MTDGTVPALGTIPQSTALVEASQESLSDLFSRDPESWSPPNWSQAIEAFRKQRSAWQQAEASGATRAPKAEKIKGPVGPAQVGL